ncbi:MAG TPA: hypothetical protein PLU35_06900 [Phycisphaerales bacterium]|nr:hypothetical protein [Phycisphaerales bacterium]
MRIPLSRVWRAFPELDRFSDEQCDRFVRAACRTGRRHLHRAALVVVFVLLVAGSLLMAGFISEAGGRRWDPLAPTSGIVNFALFLLVLLCFALPPLVVMFIRDRLLLRRIRRVLRTRGACPGCRYTLVGLPVSAALAVVCPECGYEAEVDPALRELVIDESGRGVFTPAAYREPPAFWTPRRRLWLKRTAIGLAFVLFVLLPLGWGGYEVFLSRQASLARSERAALEDIIAYVEANQPTGTTADDPNAWDAFYAAMARMHEADLLVGPGDYVGTRGVFAEYTLIFADYRTPDMDSENRAFFDACEDIARRSLAAYREGGVFDQLGYLAARRRAVRPITAQGQNQPLLAAWILPELGQARGFARMNAARMHLALEAGDLGEYADALEANLALARICAHQPLLIDALVAYAIEALAISRIRATLGAFPSEDWLDAIEGALDRQRLTVPPSFHVGGERFWSLDAVAWTFSDPSNVRFGANSAALAAFTGGVRPTDALWVGTYRGNRDAFNRYFDDAVRRADQPPHVREPAGAAPNGSLAQTFLSANETAMQVFDRARIDREGMRVLIALERYRMRHGDYPVTLTQLVPDCIDHISLDLWSGLPFGYVRVVPAADRLGRSYLLYSVGADGMDDGGHEAPRPEDRHKTVWPAEQPRLKGYDYVINGD